MRLKIPFTWITSVAILSTIGIVAMIAYFAWSSLGRIVHDLALEAEPDTRIGIVKNIAYSLSDADNAVQTYTRTAQTGTLRPYFHALSNVDAQLDSLRGLQSSPHAAVLSDSLASIAAQKFAVMDSMLKLKPSTYLDSALKDIALELEVRAEREKAAAMRGTTQSGTSSNESRVATSAKSSILKRLFNQKKPGETEETEPAPQPSPPIYIPPRRKSDLDLITAQILTLKEAEQADILRIRAHESRLLQKSQALSAQIREIIRKIESVESKALKEQAKTAQTALSEANMIIAFFSVTASLLLLVVAWSIITYTRRLIEQRSAIQYAKTQAEQLVEDRERFVAHMSHEIRTPMNAILGFTEQLLQSDLPPAQHHHLEIVHRSSQHLIEVVNTILDFTQLSSGKLVLANVGFRLLDTTALVIDLLQRQADQKGLKLILDADPSLTPIIKGDPLRFRQILLNLIGNAIKFTEQGCVTVRLLPVEGSDIGFWLEVEDTGIGIPPDRLEAIFAEYEQASASTRLRYGGSGLGLAITRKLIEMQGGSISVASWPGQGTKFSILLPSEPGTPADLPQDHRPQQSSVPPTGLRVLIADDSAYNRALLRAMLEGWKAEWLEAEDGEQALQMATNQHFDVLLLDLKMPKYSGLEVAEKIRQHYGPDQAPPMIALSADLSPTDLRRCKTLGFFDLIQKPFPAAQLGNTLSKIKTHCAPLPSPDLQTSEATPSADTTVDLTQLHTLTHGNQDFIHELIQTYVRSLEEGLEEIKKFQRAGKAESLADTCHRLAPPTAHIGASRLYAILKTLQKAARGGTPLPELLPQIHSLQDEAQAVLRALAPHMPQKVQEN